MSVTITPRVISAFATALFFSLSMSGNPALAQTPDAQTPAQEEVCDTLMADGVTKGLYGLCVAFCEAHDAASVDAPITADNLQALLDSRPNGKILENYNKRKKDADPAMPCIAPPSDNCPCFTTDELRLAFVVSPQSCRITHDNAFLSTSVAGLPADNIYASTKAYDDYYACRQTNITDEPDVFTIIYATQFAACRDSIGEVGDYWECF